jgi:DMSO/TMAO reductase YedYZ molybdopterin-dependent catalytic subunit
MKLDRRSFIRLIPLAVAATFASGLWWFSTEAATEPMTKSKTAVASSNTFDFPVTWNGDRPTEVSLEGYRLTVDGDVSKPLELTKDDLLSMPRAQMKLRIDCVDGWTAEVLWEGIPLSYLLRLAGATPEKMAYVTVESVTGYKTTLSSELREITNPNNMIALKADGSPLTVEHGYPARLVAPTKLGAGWVKYVRRITCARM